MKCHIKMAYHEVILNQCNISFSKSSLKHALIVIESRARLIESQIAYGCFAHNFTLTMTVTLVVSEIACGSIRPRVKLVCREFLLCIAVDEIFVT